MSLFYFPLIILSLLGYGYTVSDKILNLKNENIGVYGINGIFTFILISYFSTQFIAHTKIFNLMTQDEYIRVFQNLSQWDDWYIKKDNRILQQMLK